jgi:uncharacterized protein YceK
MKYQIKFFMAAGVLAMSGCSTTGALDAAMESNAKSKKADYSVMEAEYKKWLKGEGKLTVEAARRFVLPNWLRENQMSVHFSNDPFTTELFAYVLADRTDEIEWTPPRVSLLEGRTQACQRAQQASADALIEMAANAKTPTIDPRTGAPIIQGSRKFEAARATRAGSCNGVRELSAAFDRSKQNLKVEPKNKLEIE